jgi:hemerythrin-like domain-containing protein
MCNRLEKIADSLPDNADIQGCLHAAQGVVPVVKRAHEFEEFTVYPYLAHSGEVDSGLLTTLDRLRFEHLGDEEFATDLSSALRQFAISPESSNVDSLAWMLRGFFEATRRHVAFEREHLLPLVARTSGVAKSGRTA